jgi:hypothetical protein
LSTRFGRSLERGVAHLFTHRLEVQRWRRLKSPGLKFGAPDLAIDSSSAAFPARGQAFDERIVACVRAAHEQRNAQRERARRAGRRRPPALIGGIHSAIRRTGQTEERAMRRAFKVATT